MRRLLLPLLAFPLLACPPPVDGEGDNQAPLARPDDAIVMAGSSVQIDVLDNDADPDGDEITVESVTDGDGGTVTIRSDGGWVEYEADPDFEGTDSFDYTITDGVDTDTATVEVEVEALPTLTITSPPNGASVPGSEVRVAFTITGCIVDRPSDEPEGCHIHRYVDGDSYEDLNSSIGWYGPSDMELQVGEGEHTIDLILIKNDGSDDPWVPDVNDSITVTMTAR